MIQKLFFFDDDISKHLPRLSNVKTISSVTSGEYVGYRADFSLHLNKSPLESVASFEVLIVRVEDLLPIT